MYGLGLQPQFPLLLSGGIVQVIINLSALVTYGKPASEPGNQRELCEMYTCINTKQKK